MKFRYSIFFKRLFRFKNSETYCQFCKQEVDRETCHCGDYMEMHGAYDGHSPVPMGCRCGYSDGSFEVSL